MGSSHTTIAVSDRTAERLHSRKFRGESYEDVVEALLDATEPRAEPGDEIETRKEQIAN
jgi:hypothetical protein